MNVSFSPSPKRFELTLLGFIIAAGAYLRFHDLGGPSLWLDEILSYNVATAAMHQPWWRWVASTFEPEHGPLFHASLLAGRFLREPETSARVVAAICGTLTIAFVWIAARARAGAATAIAAAILVACSPLNVYYSRDGRPYAILMMLTAATLAAFALRARWVAFALLAILFAYTSGTAAPILVAIFVSAAASAVVERGVAVRAAATAAAGLAAIALIYRSHAPQSVITTNPDVEISRVLQSFSVAALQPSDAWRIAWVIAALAIAGAVAMLIRDRTNGVFLVGMALLPALGAWLVLLWLQHTFEIRYLCASLPAYLILAGAGIGELARLVARSRAYVVELVATVVAAALMWKALPAAMEEPYRKLDWKLIASTVWNHAQKDDLVIAANDWTAISLVFYMNRLPPRVRLLNAAESTQTIEHFTREHDPVWIVSAGFYRTPVMRNWLCRYPLMLASDLEEFGLHYAPSRADFVERRSTEAEQRTLVASLAQQPFALTFSATDDAFLGGGWAGTERIGGDDVRWATGTESAIVAPVDASLPHTMRVRMMPFESRGLQPQTVRVFADESEIGAATMSPGWQTYAFSIAPSAWHRSGAHTIAFRFARATVPARVDPASKDQRELSAMFTDLAIDGSPGQRSGPSVFTVRVQENGRYLDAGQWRGVRSKFAPSRWNRQALARFAARAGFDPATAVPQLLGGTLPVEQILASMIERGACLDDVAFVRNAYWSIIGRAVTEEDARRIVKPWKNERDRRRLVGGLIESSEFRDRMSAPGTRSE